MRKMWIWMLVLITLPFFPSSSVHAVTNTYDVMQFSKKLQSFSTLDQAKNYSYTYEYTIILEQPGSKLVWSNLPEGYGVYQRNKLINNFDNPNLAINEADKWDFAHVLDASTMLWIWDNVPNFDVLNASGKKLVSKGFKYLPDAFHFTESHAGSQLKNLKTSEILWNNASSTTSSLTTAMVSTLNVRSGPSTDFPIVDTLSQGQTVTLLTSGGSWNLINLSNGSKGYVYSSYISVGSSPVPVNANGKTIILDPGHGGHDSGSIGVDSTPEKVVTLNFIAATKKALEARGYNVILTRSTDADCKIPFTNTNLELGCRAKMSQNYPGSIFISLHANWDYTGSAHGTETFYNANNSYDGNMNAYPDKSKLLSDTLHKYIQPAFGSLDRKSKDSSYYVLRFNSAPAALIEVGFMSNTDDLAKLKNSPMQTTIANAIVKGVDEYFSKG